MKPPLQMTPSYGSIWVSISLSKWGSKRMPLVVMVEGQSAEKGSLTEMPTHTRS